jgi:hypothetical protein
MGKDDQTRDDERSLQKKATKAFHAITRHVIVDTRLVVHDFNIR